MIGIDTHGPFFNWLMDGLRALAEIRTPFWDSVMSAVTVLGQEIFFIIIAEILLYCYSKKSGYKFLFMFGIGTVISQALKFVFMIDRPWKIDPDFRIVESARAAATGWSFPSGHTQSAFMMYFGTARVFKKKWLWAAAAAIVLLVSFSRMYLGVHTLLDVAAALVIGAVLLLITELLFSRFGDRPGFSSLMLGAASVISLVYLIVIMVFDKGYELYADDLGTAATVFGLVFGSFCGSIVERKFIDFDTKAVWWVQIIKVVLGTAIMLGIRFGLKPLFKLIYDSPLMNAPRYFLMVFVGIAVYPILFRVLALFGNKKKESRVSSQR